MSTPEIHVVPRPILRETLGLSGSGSGYVGNDGRLLWLVSLMVVDPFDVGLRHLLQGMVADGPRCLDYQHMKLKCIRDQRWTNGGQTVAGCQRKKLGCDRQRKHSCPI